MSMPLAQVRAWGVPTPSPVTLGSTAAPPTRALPDTYSSPRLRVSTRPASKALEKLAPETAVRFTVYVRMSPAVGGVAGFTLLATETEGSTIVSGLLEPLGTEPAVYV